MTEKKNGSSAAYQDLTTLFRRPGHLVRRLHQICSSIFIDHARDLNLTAVQLATLQTVSSQPGIDQATLGKIVALDRQNASNLVSRLCERGLLERRNKDKRAHSLFITKKGTSIVQQMMHRAPAIDQKILEPLSVSESEMLLRLLTKLTTENNDLSRAPINQQQLEAITKYRPPTQKASGRPSSRKRA